MPSLSKRFLKLMPQVNSQSWLFRWLKRRKSRASYTEGFLPRPALQFQINKPLRNKRFFIRAVFFVLSILLVILLFYKLEINNIFILFKQSLLELVNSPSEISKNELILPAETWENTLLLELKNKVGVLRLSKIDNNTLQIETNEGIIILFNPQGNLKAQINSLQTILTKSRIEMRLLKRIDLRFNKIALEYQ